MANAVMTERLNSAVDIEDARVALQQRFEQISQINFENFLEQD